MKPQKYFLSVCIVAFICSSIYGQGYRITYKARWNSGYETKLILVFDDSLSFSFFTNGTIADPFEIDSIYGNRVIQHSTLYDRSSKIIYYGRIDEYAGVNEMVVDDRRWTSWTFPDKKGLTILKYKCKPALYKEKGITVQAWYSSELPFPYGPYNCFELPGLVLKMKYAGITLTAEKIEKGNFRVVKPGDADYIQRAPEK